MKGKSLVPNATFFSTDLHEIFNNFIFKILVRYIIAVPCLENMNNTEQCEKKKMLSLLFYVALRKILYIKLFRTKNSVVAPDFIYLL